MAICDKTVYLETMGCQMNVLDSELVLGRLRALGYKAIHDMTSADVVLLNTCSVREHAEQKVLSRLGALKKPKMRRPEMVVGVIGCMAERDPDGIFAKMPHVDLVCGPGELNKVPALIEEVQSTRSRAIALAQSLSRKNTPLRRAAEFDSVEALDLSRDPAPDESVLQSYVRVQRGCDKFCTFCVVPFTRGPERSRPPGQILEEARMLAERGAVEVTLLGQTVNSYVHPENGRAVAFAELLERVAGIPGLRRVRFVTSYPGDFSDDILRVMRDVPKLCPYLHIPSQSGSDAVLQRMRRQYTVGQYVDLIDRARDWVPGLALASDFIVGFSGETEEDHQATMELIRRCRFKNIFVFKYSARPGTVADRRMEDDVPDDVKRRRNIELLSLQEEISAEGNRKLIGKRVEVLVEGYSKSAMKAQEAEQTRGEEVGWRQSDQLVGRTPQDQIVVFRGNASQIGTFATVQIDSTTALTLHGEWIEGTGPDDLSSPAVREPAGSGRSARQRPRSLPVLRMLNEPSPDSAISSGCDC